jgi:CRP-like cAMP-binding protein
MGAHFSGNQNDNLFLADLPASTSAALARNLRQVRLDYGFTIYEANTPINEIYFPQSGIISLTVIMQDGDRVHTSLIGREGGVGLQRGFGAQNSLTQATVQKGGVFSVINGAAFAEALAEQEPLREMTTRHIMRLWAEAQQIVACNVLHDTRQRLCLWLLQTSDRGNSDLIELTQEKLAEMLGARRTTVTILAQSLQKDGLIEYHRGNIKILDRERLERAACECYSILRSPNHRHSGFHFSAPSLPKIKNEAANFESRL